MKVFTRAKLQAQQRNFKRPTKASMLQLLLCVILAARYAYAGYIYLPEMDQNGNIFSQQLKYNITWKSSDPAKPESTRRRLDQFETKENCTVNFAKMRDRVRTIYDSSKDIYLTTFGWDDHYHSDATLCNINKSSNSSGSNIPTIFLSLNNMNLNSFSGNGIRTDGPMSNSATLRYMQFNSTQKLPTGIDFQCDTTPTCQLGIANTCASPSEPFGLPATHQIQAMALSSKISLTFALLKRENENNYSNIDYPLLYDINDQLNSSRNLLNQIRCFITVDIEKSDTNIVFLGTEVAQRENNTVNIFGLYYKKNNSCVASFANASVSFMKYIRVAASTQTIQSPTTSGCSPTPTFTWTATQEPGPTGSNQISLDSYRSPTIINFNGPEQVGSHTWLIKATSSTGQVISYNLVVTVEDLCENTVTTIQDIDSQSMTIPSSLSLTAVMTDSYSNTNDAQTGLPFCGARIYSITQPSPLPTWITINAQTGVITLNPSDTTLAGTMVTITLKGELASYSLILPKYTNFNVTFTNVNFPTPCNKTVPSFTAIPDQTILIPYLSTNSISLSAVMKDSLSLSNGSPMDGLTFCGARTYLITTPSSIPSWLTITSSTGTIVLTPNDATLGGTTLTVTVQGLLTSSTISSTVTFKVILISCLNVVLTPPTLSNMINNTYLTKAPIQGQSYASILAGTIQTYPGLSCGAIEIDWFQMIESIDTTVFTNDKTTNTLSIFTSDEAKALVYPMYYQAYLVQYPIIKTQITFAYVQTIIDSSSAAADIGGGLLRKAPVANGQDPIAPAYSVFFGEIVSFTYFFADPLALDDVDDETQNMFGLDLKVTKNSQLEIIKQEGKVDCTIKIGFCQITFTIDGEEAKKAIASQTNSTTVGATSSSNSTTSAELAGSVSIEVKDLSMNGLTSTFEIRFKFMEHDKEKEEIEVQAKAKAAQNVVIQQAQQGMKMGKLLTNALQHKVKKSVEVKEQKVEASLKQVDDVGDIFIDFRPAIVAVPMDWDKLWEMKEREKMAPADREAYEQDLLKIMSVTFIQNSDELPQQYILSNLTKFESAGIQINLNFSDPLLVSQGAVSDRIRIRLLKSFFMQPDPKLASGKVRKLATSSEQDQNDYNIRQLASFQEDETYIFIEEDIPRQLRDKGDLQKLTSTAQKAESAMQAGFAMTFLVNLLLNGVMSQLWNIFNTLQIIMAMPQLAVMMPANVLFIQKVLSDIVNFKPVDKATIQKKIIEPIFGPPSTEDTIEGSDQSVTSKFKSDSLLLQVLTIIVVVIVMIFLVGLCVLCKRKIYPKCCQCFKSIVNMILSKLMFNSILRSLLQTFLSNCIASQTSLLKTDVSTTQGKVDLAIAIGIIIFSIGFPIFAIKFLRKKKEQLREPDFKAKYDSIYQNIEYYKDKALQNTSFFLARRFLFASVIVFCGSSIVLQVFLCDILSTLVLAYFLSVLPMNDHFNNFIQVLNEVTVIICVWLMFHYTDFVADADTRYDLGFYLMYLVAIDVIFNVIFLFYFLSKKIYLAIKAFFTRRKAAQAMALKVQQSAHKASQQMKDTKEYYQKALRKRRIEIEALFKDGRSSSLNLSKNSKSSSDSSSSSSNSNNISSSNSNSQLNSSQSMSESQSGSYSISSVGQSAKKSQSSYSMSSVGHSLIVDDLRSNRVSGMNQSNDSSSIEIEEFVLYKKDSSDKIPAYEVIQRNQGLNQVPGMNQIVDSSVTIEFEEIGPQKIDAQNQSDVSSIEIIWERPAEKKLENNSSSVTIEFEYPEREKQDKSSSVTIEFEYPERQGPDNHDVTEDYEESAQQMREKETPVNEQGPKQKTFEQIRMETRMINIEKDFKKFDIEDSAKNENVVQSESLSKLHGLSAVAFEKQQKEHQEFFKKLKIKTKEAQKPNKSVQEDSFFSRMLEDIENRKGHEDDECSDLEFAKLPIDDGVPSMFHSSAGREQSRKVNNVKNIVQSSKIFQEEKKYRGTMDLGQKFNTLFTSGIALHQVKKVEQKQPFESFSQESSQSEVNSSLQGSSSQSLENSSSASSSSASQSASASQTSLEQSSASASSRSDSQSQSQSDVSSPEQSSQSDVTSENSSNLSSSRSQSASSASVIEKRKKAKK